jgi:hypothetical protein
MFGWCEIQTLDDIPAYEMLGMVPLWVWYEAAKKGLVEIEQLEQSSELYDSERLEQRKRQMEKEIRYFEYQFPRYQRERYLQR